MTFLNPALLAGLLPLLALPLIIHLLNKRFPRLFPFSNVENIRETMARRSQLHRWRHLILLLLRTLFLLLLLFAFLKPFLDRFAADPRDQGERFVLVMFDHSLSMEHKSGGPSARERALNEAERLLDSLDPQDWVNVVLSEQSPQTCFVDFSQNHAEAKRFLRLLKPGLLRGDVNQANALAGRLLTKARGRVDVYYLSDFQRKNWANTDFTALPPTARLFFVDVGAARKDNHAVLEAKISGGQILAGDTVPLEISVGNFSEEPFQNRVTVQVDKRISFDQELFIAPWSVGRSTIPVPVGGPGLHLCDVSLPADGLPQDDRFGLVLPVLEKEEVLIVSDETGAKQDSAFFLKTALNPFENQRGSLLPQVITSRELTPSRLAGVKKMFFTRLGRLDDATCQVVAKYLFGGGGLIYFLDSDEDPQNLLGLGIAMGPDSMPLRLTSKRVARNVTTGAQQIVKGDFKSRYLKLFRGVTRQDLGLLEFYDYYQASSTGGSSVLLMYADESPAMTVVNHGLGTVLLLNFSAGELSSNLARQRIFPAWIQDMVKAIATDEPLPTSFPVGDPLQTEVWKNELRDAEFKNPAGQTVTVKREPQGERFTVSFTPDQLGFYTMGGPPPLHAFAVNASPDESDLRAVDKDMLPSALPDKQQSQAHFVAGREDYDEAQQGRPLFHYFVFAAVGLLLLESGFQLLLRRVKA